MKRILATTALTASLCMPAFAQDATTAEETTAPEAGTEMMADGGFIQTADPKDVMASDFIGKRVYAMSGEMEYGEEGVEQADAEWDDIGEVSDVILARTGEVEGVIVDVGGFLGMGEKPVALTMDSLQLVADSNSPGDYFVTVSSSREALDQAPAFEFTDPAAEMEQAEAADGSMATPLEETPGEEAEMAETGDNAADTGMTDTGMTDDVAEADADIEEAGENAEAEMAEAGDAMENAGEEVEQEVAEAGSEIDAAADEAEAEMADAGAEVEAAADEAGAEMAEAGEEIEGAAEEAGNEMADAAEDTEAAVEGETEMADASQEGDMTGFTREGYSEVMVTELSSEDLTGLAVYDPNENRVGEISEILISSDGVVTDAVIDVGGFLGIGEKPVAISFKGISLQQQSDGDDLRAYVNTTEEQLESFPEYEDG
ncbi:PRC-barrel domain-containing protein [Vannielia litorea]|uniref:PRC-barrel domain-containing protein n=1 Tax=Vannielia litorea TaxID=1217970 RepID=UPI001BCB13D4|nr:PRC-barrel domain-containing protein [Vannielia litorea]MBS8225659.1 PRC-barrel domain containing protein [Vannielia litorea]